MKFHLAYVTACLSLINWAFCNQISDIRKLQNNDDDTISCLVVEVEKLSASSISMESDTRIRRCIFLDDGYDTSFSLENIDEHIWAEDTKLGSATHVLTFAANDADITLPENNDRNGGVLRLKRNGRASLVPRDKNRYVGGSKCDSAEESRRQLGRKGNFRNRRNNGRNGARDRGNNRGTRGNNRGTRNGKRLAGCRAGRHNGKPNNDGDDDSDSTDNDTDGNNRGRGVRNGRNRDRSRNNGGRGGRNGRNRNGGSDRDRSGNNGAVWANGGIAKGSGNRRERRSAGRGNNRGGRRNNRGGRGSRERDLVQLQGTSSVLVIRITDQVNDAPLKSAAELSDDIFLDSHNLVSRFRECSGGKLIMTPATGQNIVNGVAEVTIPHTVAGITDTTVEGWAVTAATSALGSLGQWTHVMIILPGSVNFGGAAAYAYLNWYLSVYRDFYASHVQVQVHEIGHNLYNGHSGEGTQVYGDGTCMMGAARFEDDRPVMCFNGPKSWYMGWYSDRHVSIDPTIAAFDGKMVGINDYLNGEIPVGSTEHHVIAMVGVNLYIMYNRREGINSGVVEKADLVTVVEQSLPFNFQSWIRAGLDTGGEWRSPNYRGGASDLVIKVCEKVNGTPDYARTLVYLDGVNTLSCSSTNAPSSSPTTTSPSAITKAPTGSPTASPTAPPTAPPTMPPTAPPTIPPTATPTTKAPGTMSPSATTKAPTGSPTASPTLPPTAPPTQTPTMPPTAQPTMSPTAPPTMPPTTQPTIPPTSPPTMPPTSPPTRLPTLSPTPHPTALATPSPTGTGGCSQVQANLIIKFDWYPREVGWVIKDSATGLVVNSVAAGSYGWRYSRQKVYEPVTLMRGKTYTLEMQDSYGDGICCSYGYGYYKLEVDGSVVASGGQYERFDAQTFTLPCTPPNTSDITVEIKFDKFADEIGWSIIKVSDSSTVTFVHPGRYRRPRYKRRRIQESVQIENGESYRFTIFDIYGDGLCCMYGRGWYEVTDYKGTILARGDSFGRSEESIFVVT